MPVTFKRADTLGEGWKLKVLKAGRAVARILRGTDGTYRVYRGGGGAGTPLLQSPLAENTDLEKLKEWARAHFKNRQ
jgi:hypothetical protein